MSTKATFFSEPGLMRQALICSIIKLSPHIQWRNPVMFMVWVGSVITTLLTAGMWCGLFTGNTALSAAISGWLWLTLLFANFAEALAEGRSKAQASALRGSRQQVDARKLAEPDRKSVV